MSTHAAVVTVATRAPLEIRQVPTIHPSEGEVRVRVEWTASTPLDLHQADGGLLVKHPQVLGDGVAGTVVEVGPGVKRLKVNDEVFGFTWRSQKEKAHQTYATVPENLLGILPDGVTMQEAVTLPNNFVTAYHTIVTDLGLPLPWPKPSDYRPEHSEDPILIWGGSSSVGQYALQILEYFGYQNLMATASPQHHDLLRSFGAAHVFDYHNPDVAKRILSSSQRSGEPAIPFILDCIGSRDGSVRPLAHIAQRRTKVAVLLPIINRDATDTDAPEYTMDVQGAAEWADGVEGIGVRTHFYLDVSFQHDALTFRTPG
jgi:NADPH:quinone reductase-like Zn-dependent oxidoreductase